MPADLDAIIGVAPFAVVLRVLHVVAPDGAEAPGRAAAAHQATAGWDVVVALVDDWEGAAAAHDPDVVVLHGPRAGRVRRHLRGRRATVFLPYDAVRGWRTAAFERVACRWTSALAVPDDAGARACARAHLWAPVFVTDSPDRLAAVIARAHAYGTPSRPAPDGTPP